MALRTFARTFLGRVCLAGALAAAALTLAGCDGKNMDSMMDCPLPVVYDFSLDGLSGYFVDSLPPVSKNCCKTLFDESNEKDSSGASRGYVRAGSLAQPLFPCRDSSADLKRINTILDQCMASLAHHQLCKEWQDSKPPPAEWPEHDPAGFVKTMNRLGLWSSFASALANLFQKFLEVNCGIGNDAKVGFTMVQIVTTVGSYTLWLFCWLLGPLNICVDTLEFGTTNPVMKFALNPTWFPLLSFLIGTGAWVVNKIKDLDEGTNTRTPPTRAKLLQASFSGYYADAVMGSITSMKWGGPGDHFDCVQAGEKTDFSTNFLMYLSSFCLVWTLYGVLYDNMKWRPCCGCDTNLACMTATAGIVACACRTGQTLQSLVSGNGLISILPVTWLRSFLQLLEDLTKLSYVCTGREHPNARDQELMWAAREASEVPPGC